MVSDELVKTVEGGALHIRFLDNTKLRLGSSSRLALHPDGVHYVVSGSWENVFVFRRGSHELVRDTCR